MAFFKKDTNEKNQLTISYEAIDPNQVVNRDYLRANFPEKGQLDYYLIPFERLGIRQGYNRQLLTGIEELAENMRLIDLQKPLTVDVLKDGRVLIMRGERRYRAISNIRKNPRRDDKNSFDFVRCFVNTGKVTEFERATDLFIDNSGQPLHVLDEANKVKNLKYNFGETLTNDAIAKAINMSRQKVEWLLIIADLDDQTKAEIKAGEMSAKQAVAHVRANRKAKKDAEQEELNSHKTNPNPPQEPIKDAIDRLADEMGLNNDDNEQEPAKFSPKEVFGESPLPAKTKTTTTTTSRDHAENDNDNGVMYDSNRQEIADIQNAIQLSDRIGVRVERLGIAESIKDEIAGWKKWASELEISGDDKNYIISMIGWMEGLVKMEGDKKDIADWIRWQQTSLFNTRDWIHKNKPKN